MDLTTSNELDWVGGSQKMIKYQKIGKKFLIRKFKTKTDAEPKRKVSVVEPESALSRRIDLIVRVA